jgi:hypothetical protein
MPSNWAFAKIVTTKNRDISTTKSIEIDRNVVSKTYQKELVQPNNTLSERSFKTCKHYLSTIFEGNEGYRNIVGNSDSHRFSLGAIQ